jgi:hypothetical protein
MSHRHVHVVYSTVGVPPNTCLLASIALAPPQDQAVQQGGMYQAAQWLEHAASSPTNCWRAGGQLTVSGTLGMEGCWASFAADKVSPHSVRTGENKTRSSLQDLGRGWRCRAALLLLTLQAKLHG